MPKSLNPIYEKKLLEKGYDIVVGIDEAGRGPWAGPVAVAGFIYQKAANIVSGVNDSKSISHKKRIETFTYIKEYLTDSFIINLTPAEEIDKSGIGNAITNSISSIVLSVKRIYPKSKIMFLIDGYFKESFNCEFELIKKGDSKIYTIAAASIIAKESRDEVMNKYAKEFPQYGFEKHVGYGTKQHASALKKYGPCEIHRMSFKPLSLYRLSHHP